jgi:hypothetical protein
MCTHSNVPSGCFWPSVQSSLKSRNINIFLDAYFCHEKVRRDSYP